MSEQEVVTLQTPVGTDAEGDIIHRYSFPLGGPRWLDAAYVKRRDGYVWVFRRGGEMRPEMWAERIATGLSRVGRFGGMPNYSVGRHCVLLSRYLAERGYAANVQLLALFHDAPECLGVGDMNANLKNLIGHAARSYEDDLLAFLMGEQEVEVSEADENVVHAADKLFGHVEAEILDMQNGHPFPAPADHPIRTFLSGGGDNEPWDMNWSITRQEWLFEYVRIRREIEKEVTAF